MANGKRWFGAGVVGLAAALSLAMLHSRHKHRRLLQCGELRPLERIWHHVNGHRIHSRVSTTAASADELPVVMIHGLGVSGSYFVPLAERLATTFPVYVPDLPGHGRSGTPPHALPAQDLAGIVLAWMDALGLERAAFIGHSMGCQTVVEIALQAPSRVYRLVLMGPVPDPGARSLARQFRRFLVTAFYERPSLMVPLVRDYARMGLRIVPEFRFMLNEPLEQKLPRVNTPALLLRGERDAIVPQAWLNEAARLLPAARTAVIQGWGHAIQYSTPESVIGVIYPFLRDT